MALRTIRIQGDPVLEKKCREITEMTPKLQTLIEDMLDTMYDAMGVGLAAPQVGILKRVVVIDVGEGPIVMINPEIIETSGEQTGDEGCLSLPGKAGCLAAPARRRGPPPPGGRNARPERAAGAGCELPQCAGSGAGHQLPV